MLSIEQARGDPGPCSPRAWNSMPCSVSQLYSHRKRRLPTDLDQQ